MICCYILNSILTKVLWLQLVFINSNKLTQQKLLHKQSFCIIHTSFKRWKRDIYHNVTKREQCGKCDWCSLNHFYLSELMRFRSIMRNCVEEIPPFRLIDVEVHYNIHMNDIVLYHLRFLPGHCCSHLWL